MDKQPDFKKQGRPSLRTVAKAVGLSPTAVSLALRGDASIPDETRKRVIEAAQSLGYKYVSRAKKKPQKRLRRLLYVVNDYGDEPAIANPFYDYILSGVEMACRSLDASLSFVVLPHLFPPTQQLPAVLVNDLDGILLASPYPYEQAQRIYRESGRPIVLIDNFFPGCEFDSVMADDYGGGYQITEHLLGLGHRRISMILGRTYNPDFPPSFYQRYRGYRQACLDAGIEPREMAILSPDADPPSILKAKEPLKAWLHSLLSSPEPPTALFCAADFFAISIMAALEEMGIRVPDDISVAGYDDFPSDKVVHPGLTTIHSYKRAIARISVERILARIDGDDSPAMKIALTTKLVVRESTKRVEIER